jgi:hypothetical protein
MEREVRSHEKWGMEEWKEEGEGEEREGEERGRGLREMTNLFSGSIRVPHKELHVRSFQS